MSDKESLKPVIEAVIFAAESAISFERLASVLEGEEKNTVKEALKELIEDYSGGARGFFIEEVAGGYQFRTNPDYAPWLRRLFKIGAQKISKAAMESLAIVAYKQPLTRGELEAIRGVDSGGVLATLMEKRFIKIVGRKEAPGRPVVYGTTREFLEMFDLKDLSCLPSLKDIKQMEEENAPQDTDAQTGADEARDGQGEAGEQAPDGQDGEKDGGRGAEASEDNSRGRDNIEEEGRGADNAGQGDCEPGGGDGAGGQG